MQLEDNKKNTDYDELEELKQKYQTAMDALRNSMRELVEEVTSDVSSWADSLESAIRSAFQNGENAARAFRSTVKQMIGDIVSEMIKMQVLEPVINAAMEEWTHSAQMLNNDNYYDTKTIVDKNGNKTEIKELKQDKYLKEILRRLGDEELAEQFSDKINELGDLTIDWINGLNPFLRDAYLSNGDVGSLSGGIESVTEDTARRIEALSNSQLAETIAIRQYMETMQNNSISYYSDVSATMLSISQKADELCYHTKSISEAIDEVRNNVRPLYVVSV